MTHWHEPPKMLPDKVEEPLPLPSVSASANAPAGLEKAPASVSERLPGKLLGNLAILPDEDL